MLKKKNKKKLHCKHGLEGKTEIQARRIRQKLEEGDNEIIEIYNKWLFECISTPNKTFEDYLQEKDPVYYSAYMRAVERKGKEIINQKIIFKKD